MEHGKALASLRSPRGETNQRISIRTPGRKASGPQTLETTPRPGIQPAYEFFYPETSRQKHIAAADIGMAGDFATSQAGGRGLVREGVAHTFRHNYSAPNSRVLLTFIHSAAKLQNIGLERKLDRDRPAAFDAEAHDVLPTWVLAEHLFRGFLSFRPVILVHPRQAGDRAPHVDHRARL